MQKIDGKKVVKIIQVESEDVVVLWLEPECKLKKRKKPDQDEHDNGGSGPNQTPVSSRIPNPRRQRC